MRRRRPVGEKRILVIGTLLVAVVLAVVAGAILADRAEGRRDLDERFHARAELTASFVRDFVTDLAERERAQAERLLAAPAVAQEDLDTVVEAFGFDAAVLLDGEGRLLRAHPAGPELEGTDLAAEYQHLRRALRGVVGVSAVVPSAVEGIPVTAVATPFESATGRRVLSGAFALQGTPLGAYLDSIVPVRGGNAFLVDDTGQLLAAGDSGISGPPEVLSVTADVTSVDIDGTTFTAATDAVVGAPWRVVLLAPSGPLHAPATGNGWVAWALWGLLAVLCLAVQQLALRLNRSRSEAAERARTDELTGLPNRRAVAEQLDIAGKQARRDVEGATLLLIDVDHFKQVNDRHGHAAGDEALRVVAAALRASVREGDLVGRWGGEEFLAVLFPTARSSSVDVAERLRATVAAAPMPFGPEDTCCTVSIGVAAIVDGDVDAALSEADAALYRAKTEGRNRVVRLVDASVRNS